MVSSRRWTDVEDAIILADRQQNLPLAVTVTKLTGRTNRAITARLIRLRQGASTVATISNSASSTQVTVPNTVSGTGQAATIEAMAGSGQVATSNSADYQSAREAVSEQGTSNSADDEPDPQTASEQGMSTTHVQVLIPTVDDMFENASALPTLYSSKPEEDRAPRNEESVGARHAKAPNKYKFDLDFIENPVGGADDVLAAVAEEQEFLDLTRNGNLVDDESAAEAVTEQGMSTASVQAIVSPDGDISENALEVLDFFEPEAERAPQAEGSVGDRYEAASRDLESEINLFKDHVNEAYDMLANVADGWGLNLHPNEDRYRRFRRLDDVASRTMFGAISLDESSSESESESSPAQDLVDNGMLESTLHTPRPLAQSTDPNSGASNRGSGPTSSSAEIVRSSEQEQRQGHRREVLEISDGHSSESDESSLPEQAPTQGEESMEATEDPIEEHHWNVNDLTNWDQQQALYGLLHTDEPEHIVGLVNDLPPGFWESRDSLQNFCGPSFADVNMSQGRHPDGETLNPAVLNIPAGVPLDQAELPNEPQFEGPVANLASLSQIIEPSNPLEAFDTRQIEFLELTVSNSFHEHHVRSWWDNLATGYFPGRTGDDLRRAYDWRQSMNADLPPRERRWTAAEDMMLIGGIEYKQETFVQIANQLDRGPEQCEERYHMLNYDHDVNKLFDFDAASAEQTPDPVQTDVVMTDK